MLVTLVGFPSPFKYLYLNDHTRTLDDAGQPSHSADNHNYTGCHQPSGPGVGTGMGVHATTRNQPNIGPGANVYPPGYIGGQPHPAGYGAPGAMPPTTGGKMKGMVCPAPYLVLFFSPSSVGELQKAVGSLLDDPDLVRKGEAKKVWPVKSTYFMSDPFLVWHNSGEGNC
jgi:hypothetical protein